MQSTPSNPEIDKASWKAAMALPTTCGGVPVGWQLWTGLQTAPGEKGWLLMGQGVHKIAYLSSQHLGTEARLQAKV